MNKLEKILATVALSGIISAGIVAVGNYLTKNKVYPANVALGSAAVAAMVGAYATHKQYPIN